MSNTLVVPINDGSVKLIKTVAVSRPNPGSKLGLLLTEAILFLQRTGV